MRSTLEILIAVDECQEVTLEETKMALAALDSICYFTKKNLDDLIEAIEKEKNASLLLKMKLKFAKDTQESMFQARKKDPMEWLGPNNIPGSPEKQRFHEIAKKVFKKATGEDL